MNLKPHKGDFVGGLLAGLVTGLGAGLLMAPGRGVGVGALQRSDIAQRIAASGPLLFEAGLALLTQTRPVLGRAAWALVHLAGRAPRGGGGPPANTA
ncbi:MAG: hypothetical protein ACYC3S_00595 [Chloroflexota bacterium]